MMHWGQIYLAMICVSFAVPPSALADDVVFSEERNVKDGDTRVKGTGKVTILANGSLRAEVNVTVRKTGVTGTGKGSLSLILLDLEGKPLQTINAGRTVGADLSGAAEKDDSKSVTLFPAVAAKVGGAMLDPMTDDDKGYPTNLPDLITKIGDLNKRMSDAGLPSFKDLGAGQVKSLGNAIVKKWK